MFEFTLFSKRCQSVFVQSVSAAHAREYAPSAMAPYLVTLDAVLAQIALMHTEVPSNVPYVAKVCHQKWLVIYADHAFPRERQIRATFVGPEKIRKNEKQ